MKTPLLPTQLVDVEQISDREDLPNFSEPGTGKTLTTVGAIEKLRLRGGVVICPSVATIMWKRVLENELGATVQWLKTRSDSINHLADFYVISYGVVTDHAPALLDGFHSALVLDESHYLKGSDAARTKAVFGEACDGIGGLYETSEQCWCLTGTPMERYADDLWSQLRATQPEILQKHRALSLDAFQRQFCRMEWKSYGGGAVEKYVSTANQNERLLNRMLYNEVHGIGAIRRTMAEVDPYMPETSFRTIAVKAKISAELKSLLVGKSQLEIMEMILAGGDAITKARRLMGMAKVDDVVAYVKEQGKGHPVIVGYWHTEVGKAIYEKLAKAKLPVNLIGGATSAEAREKTRLRFMDGGIDIIVGQIQAMGVAMDGLQARGSHAIFAEYDWSWAKMEQFYKRVARKGQERHTQVDFCNSLEAVDTALEKISDRKRAGMQVIVG